MLRYGWDPSFGTYPSKETCSKADTRSLSANQESNVVTERYELGQPLFREQFEAGLPFQGVSPDVVEIVLRINSLVSIILNFQKPSKPPEELPDTACATAAKRSAH